MLYYKIGPNRILFISEYVLFVSLVVSIEFLIVRKIKKRKSRVKELKKMKKELQELKNTLCSIKW
jgi:hypothetical protein